MSLDESFLEKLRALPPDKQREAINFVEVLARKNLPQGEPRRNLEGLWAEFDTHITEQDIAEVRAEMWRGFPREDF